MKKLYLDTILEQNEQKKVFIRKFENINLNEMVWHRDKADRKVELLEGEVFLYMDNQVPIKMQMNKIYKIPKETYHKALPLTDYLKIKIIESF